MFEAEVTIIDNPTERAFCAMLDEAEANAERRGFQDARHLVGSFIDAMDADVRAKHPWSCQHSRDYQREVGAALRVWRREPAYVAFGSGYAAEVAKYGNAVGIVEALAYCRAEANDRFFPVDWVRELDAVVPLNMQAIDPLIEAYHDVGTFRSRAELVRRMDRFSPASVEAA
jgi:hypothetical protein